MTDPGNDRSTDRMPLGARFAAANGFPPGRFSPGKLAANGAPANGSPANGAPTAEGAEGFTSEDAYLGALTGVRSGKHSYYPEYVRSAQRLENAVRALDRISQALVRTSEGPRALVEAVVGAAAEHLQADWLLVAVADGALQAARPRFLLLAAGKLIGEEAALPAEVRPHLHTLRARPWEAKAARLAGRVAQAPMTLDGEPVGGIVGLPGKGVDIADTDLAILRVLANQAAVALHNSYLLHATSRLRGRTEALTEAAARHARDLAERNAELEHTQQRLLEAMQLQALDDERHRIARELHDSVTQDVLSAGMTIEVCRAELARTREQDPATIDQSIIEQLGSAKDLTRHSVERLRAAIYALHNGSEEPPGSLPVLLERLSSVHLPSDLKVDVTVRGAPAALPGDAEHSLLRLTGEALFNAASHSTASRARIRLHYREDSVTLSVSDDGDGDPAHLRAVLRLASRTDLSGGHCGLANMRARTHELGGTMSIRRARIGGVAVRLRIPLPRNCEGTST